MKASWVPCSQSPLALDNQRMRTLLPVLLALTLLPGCFFSRTARNQRIAQESVAQLVPGRSTAADVVALLGAPTEVVQLGHRSAYRYEHTKQKQAVFWLLVIAFRGVDAQQDRAWVFFDENDVLTHVGATFDGDKPTYSVPPFGSSVEE